jgi:acetyl esterase/lipase
MRPSYLFTTPLLAATMAEWVSVKGKNMRFRYMLLAFAAIIGVVLMAGIAWVVRYQSLNDDSEELALVPDWSDVTYCSPAGAAQKLDLYLPHDADSGLWPVLVYVHGGGFVGGDKRKGSGLTDIPAMVARGYAVAAINYRLTRDDRFPAAIQDVKCAIRFLRAGSRVYNLDPTRVGIWDGSAGGNLAPLAGLAGPDAGFEAGQYLDQSSAVRAVADMFGPTDLTAPDFNRLQRYLLNRAFGTTDASDPTLVAASPVNYAHAGAPPFLILHGTQDTAVPLSQSQRFHGRLLAAGADAQLIVVSNANHNFKPTGGPISPSRAEISVALVDFFDRRLK